MKILYIVDPHAEPGHVAGYFAERFGAAPLEIDVLSVLPADADEPAPSRQDSNVSLELMRRHSRQRLPEPGELVATRLREQSGNWTVMAHTAHGRSLTAIRQAANNLGSELVMLDGATGRAQAGRYQMLASRLAPQVACSIEIIKPYAAVPRSLFNVLVPLDVAALDTYPLERLCMMPWAPGTSLHVLGLVNFEEPRAALETTAFRMYEMFSNRSSTLVRAAAVLTERCRELALGLDGGVEIDGSVVAADDSDAVLNAAQQQRSSMIVLRNLDHERHRFPGRGRSMMAEVAQRSPCSVLVFSSIADKFSRVAG